MYSSLPSQHDFTNLTTNEASTSLPVRLPVSRLLLRGLALHSTPQRRLALICKSFSNRKAGKVARKMQIRGKNGRVFLRTYYTNPADEAQNLSIFGSPSAKPVHAAKVAAPQATSPQGASVQKPKFVVQPQKLKPTGPQNLSLFSDEEPGSPPSAAQKVKSSAKPQTLDLFSSAIADDVPSPAKAPAATVPANSGNLATTSSSGSHHNGISEFFSDTAPHLMTRREFSDEQFPLQLPHKREFLGGIHHKEFVKQAIINGKEVPEGVLRDYPDLAKQAASRPKPKPEQKVAAPSTPAPKPKAEQPVTEKPAKQTLSAPVKVPSETKAESAEAKAPAKEQASALQHLAIPTQEERYAMMSVMNGMTWDSAPKGLKLKDSIDIGSKRFLVYEHHAPQIGKNVFTGWQVNKGKAGDPMSTGLWALSETGLSRGLHAKYSVSAKVGPATQPVAVAQSNEQKLEKLLITRIQKDEALFHALKSSDHENSKDAMRRAVKTALGFVTTQVAKQHPDLVPSLNALAPPEKLEHLIDTFHQQAIIDGIDNIKGTYHYETDASGKSHRVRGAAIEEQTTQSIGKQSPDAAQSAAPASPQKTDTQTSVEASNSTNKHTKLTDDTATLDQPEQQPVDSGSAESARPLRGTHSANRAGSQSDAGGASAADGSAGEPTAGAGSSSRRSVRATGSGGSGGGASSRRGVRDVSARVPESKGLNDSKPIEYALSENPLSEHALIGVPSDGNPGDLRLDDSHRIGQGSLNEKFEDNIAAITTLRQLEAENRLPNDDEKLVLARYVGWGGFGQAFQDQFKRYDSYASFADLPEREKRYWTATDITHFNRYARIKALLTPEEYEAAKSSTLNAHFTEPRVIHAVWEGVRQLGFKGGRTLEPAMGTGNFYGFMPDDLVRHSVRTGVELDNITGKIAQMLYPHAQVHVKGFQDAPLADESFDLAISNIPFGNYGVNDAHFTATNRRVLTEKIHDYFFAKTLDKVRPGGLVAFVTSKGTLDKQDSKVRDYLAREADFIGAIRLPNTAFAENAATKVTTDIIFLRKKDPVNDAAFEALHPRDALGRFIKSWTKTKTVRVKRGGYGDISENISVNEYFVENPHMMLGVMGVGSGFGLRENSTGMKPLPEHDTPEKLSEAIKSAMAHLPSGVMSSPAESGTAKIVTAAHQQFQAAAEYHKPLAFLHHRNSLEEDELLRVHLPQPLDAAGRRVMNGHLLSIDELEKEHARILRDDSENQFQFKEELKKGVDGLIYHPERKKLSAYNFKGTGRKRTANKAFEVENVDLKTLPLLVGDELTRKLLGGAKSTGKTDDGEWDLAPAGAYHLGGGVRIAGYASPRDEYLMRHLGHLFDANSKVGGTTRSRLAAMTRLRDDAQELIARMYDASATERDLEPLRATLKVSYDNFSKKYGLLNDDVNIRLFRSDPDAGLLRALEVVERIKQPNAKTKSGFSNPKPVLRGLADLFTKRTITPTVTVSKAESPEDALLVSLNEHGVLNWDRIGQLLGRNPHEVLGELSAKGLVYRDPQKVLDDATLGYVVADEYLSGNVKKKLRDVNSALEAAQSQLDMAHKRLASASVDSRDASEAAVRHAEAQVREWQRGKEALETVIPADLPPSKIDAKLGATWISATDIESFVEHITGAKNKPNSSYKEVIVTYSRGRNKWDVTMNGAGDNLRMWSQFGTKDVGAVELIENALNLKDPVVTVTDKDGKSILQEKETEAAKEKLQIIRDEFRKWLWSDGDRAERLLRNYNDTFNHTVERKWNGAHLTLPGMAPEIRARMYPHQLDMIWRNIQQGRTLTDHVVGAGKTLEAIGTVMELRRLGIAKKPTITIPNHMLAQVDAEFRATYPGAKVLTLWANDWTPATRRMKTDQIATGDWDCILITHKSFEQIPLQEESYQKYLDKEMDAARYELSRAEQELKENPNDRRKNRSFKEQQTIIENFEAKVKARMDEVRSGKDNSLKWEELGIDHLIVDESDAFKNLFFTSKLRNVKGLPRSESARSMDMYIKSGHILAKNRNRGLGFMTGTPISNSMSEMYTLQRYLGSPAETEIK